ncbi:site-specific integrase [Paenibacillus alvei]|uniref:tyrosine-type recombinase/integrase n=1 Tax=Paenibacillus alvei TaxID=44250 RepID=UPI00227E901D|nr:site-specific integrase [Paenibacillus alvei]MCY9737549.1 site-specific integrase [Paenibacillus alvei]
MAKPKKDPVKLYNEEVKHDFLQLYSKGSEDYYKRIFEKSVVLENRLDRDLFDFTLEELEDLMFDLDPMTINAAQTNYSIISSYISFAIDKGYRTNSINSLKAMGSTWSEKFVDKSKKLYFSSYEIDEIILNLDNAQDAVIVSLLFHGVCGKEFSEIRNLTKHDLDLENNILTLRNEKGLKRKLHVKNENLFTLLRQAFAQTKYVKRNRQMDELSNSTPEIDLVANDFIVRKTAIVGRDNDPVEKNVIFRRINLTKELFDIPYFTTKNIFRSGVIAEAKEVYLREGKLEKDQLTRIANKFQIANTHLMKEYCNIDNIMALYGDEIRESEEGQ